MILRPIQQKYTNLQQIIKSYKSVIIGFSGGVDSTLLAKVAYDTLDNRSLAVIGISPSYPKREEKEAIQLAETIGIPYITIATHEMDIEEYRRNQGERCYYCKRELYGLLQKVKEKYDFNEIIDGTHLSDLGGHRPGFRATEELNIKKPFIEASFTKEDIRTLAHELSLPNWDKPAFACLSSRFPTGTNINTEALLMVEQGEQVLYDLGFRQFRLRFHQDIARIQLLEEDFTKLFKHQVRITLTNKLKEIGFSFVTLDLIEYKKESTSIESCNLQTHNDFILTGYALYDTNSS
ncbi:MAG TPA: ATP-dependent sacrificial sulfur transferase LarE [Spirochaetes bacterium]|nr:ATP-dependent sacrificial sulfur transferase LarE [Spirochaetota bacterium]